MKITQTPDGTIIKFAKQTNSRVNILLYLKAIGCLCVSLLCIASIAMLIHEPKDTLSGMLFSIGMGAIFFIAFNRYINKATAIESLDISNSHVNYIQFGQFSKICNAI